MATSQNITSDEAERTPRFSRAYSSGLGSPFLTTSDLPHDGDILEPSGSQSGQSSYIIHTLTSDDMEQVDGAFAAVPRALTVTRPPSPSLSFRTDSYSIINWNPETIPSAYADERTPRCLSSGRRTLSGYRPYSTSHFPSNGSPSSPSPLKPSRSLTLGIGIIPRIWDALREGSPGKKGKRRPGLPSAAVWREGAGIDDEYGIGEYVDYLNMPPLDGEEGELIDDEACFIDATRITGTDIVGHLPIELALHLLSFLDLPTVLACLRVCRLWNRLARDNSVWRALFERREIDGWRIDLRRAAIPAPLRGSLTASRLLVPSPLEIDWYRTYWTKSELDRRWTASGKTEGAIAYDPKVRRISGHRDSVYCLEFDSSRIITGSRDRTIKVWSLRTGRCLATFAGHRASVLCLKFDKDWDVGEADETYSFDGDDERTAWRRGFMVSGSSDCSVCVWSLCSRPSSEGGEDSEITAEVTAVLRGHSGGVLDLRIDSRWIVSCSKDALIRVWDRKTLRLRCTFRGHEGPVNAVGLQGNRVVSASGDGRMMLWDIMTGERLRTFEGHERGLACIEFKDDIIISGSNDCKIKIWSASTGVCLRTLVGHERLVRALSFDPRSGRLVSASYDRSVKVWDLHSGKMLREFCGCHVSHIFDVKFDQCRIVSTSHDRKIVVLDFSDGLDVSLFV